MQRLRERELSEERLVSSLRPEEPDEAQRAAKGKGRRFKWSAREKLLKGN